MTLVTDCNPRRLIKLGLPTEQERMMLLSKAGINMPRKEPLLGKLYCAVLTVALLLCFTGITGAVFFVTWTRPGGTTANQSVTTDNNGVTRFSTSGGWGTHTLTIQVQHQRGGGAPIR